MYPKALYVLDICSTTEPHPQTLSMSSRDSLMILKMVYNNETKEINKSYD